MKAVIPAAWVLLAACNGKHEVAPEIATLPGTPIEAQLSTGNLIFKTTDPNEDPTSQQVLASGPHQVLYSVPLAGGSAAEVARIPIGDFRVGRNGIAIVAKGQVAVVEPDGQARRLAAVGVDAKAPAWVDDSIVTLANNARHGVECCDLTSVSTKDGATTVIGKLKGIGDADVAVTDDDVFMAEVSSGETIKLEHGGKVVEVATAGDGALTCFAATRTEIWWIRWVEKANHSVISAMARNGGTIATVAEVADKDGGCAAASDELYYVQGKRIVSITPSGKSRIVHVTASEPRTLIVAGTKLYWTERGDKAWSLHSMPLQ